MKLVTQAVDFEGLDIFGVDEVTWIGVVFNELGDAANYFSHVDRLLYVIIIIYQTVSHELCFDTVIVGLVPTLLVMSLVYHTGASEKDVFLTTNGSQV